MTLKQNPCPTGNMIFASFEEAKKYYRDFPKSVRVWPYECAVCGGWHDTPPPKRSR